MSISVRFAILAFSVQISTKRRERFQAKKNEHLHLVPRGEHAHITDLGAQEVEEFYFISVVFCVLEDYSSNSLGGPSLFISICFESGR